MELAENRGVFDNLSGFSNVSLLFKDSYDAPNHLLYCQIQDDFLLGMNVHEWVWNNEYNI